MGKTEKSNSAPEDRSDCSEQLNELRTTLDRAETLNNTLESKASTLLGFSALLISIIIFTLGSLLTSPLKMSICNIKVELIFFISTIGVILIILWGIKYLWEVIKLRTYTYPFYFDPNNISRIINMPKGKFCKEMIKDYRLAIPHHTCINIKKKDSLNDGMKRLAIGFFLSFSLMLILIYLKMACGSYGG